MGRPAQSLQEVSLWPLQVPTSTRTLSQSSSLNVSRTVISSTTVMNPSRIFLDNAGTSHETSVQLYLRVPFKEPPAPDGPLWEPAERLLDQSTTRMFWWTLSGHYTLIKTCNYLNEAVKTQRVVLSAEVLSAEVLSAEVLMCGSSPLKNCCSASFSPRTWTGSRPPPGSMLPSGAALQPGRVEGRGGSCWRPTPNGSVHRTFTLYVTITLLYILHNLEHNSEY